MTSFHHQPEAQHPISSAIHKLPADYPIYWIVVSTGRRNTGAQLAINNDDGLPNACQIAFGDFPRNQLFHNTIFSARPHTTTNSLTYRLTLFIFSSAVKCCVDRLSRLP